MFFRDFLQKCCFLQKPMVKYPYYLVKYRQSYDREKYCPNCKAENSWSVKNYLWLGEKFPLEQLD